ncbi:jg16028 [Pararge aegeria aegeria]|uniref:Jg16028 protein n=1 Tax=Pararge aegeria aegeria TaxID=348720 RepID=A0A8S4SR95_9NEOP|nr:jg16028 [Pararge aegeria aegeria]
MSCKENESGPFVVFFLPAVVGCLTILLARRWATSQVSNTSTAVSRRRKINKDPNLKRPLPLIATKMVAPGAKKSFGNAKKVSQGGAPQVSDEDINGKRTRPHLSPSSTTSVRDGKLAANPLPPKHIPFPNIPQDGEVLFEIMSFIFTIVAMGLQFLNLYRTMWWLPYSFTSDAMNFYLIDTHLATFILIVLCRRLLLSLSLAFVRSCCDFSPSTMLYVTVVVRMSVLWVILGAMAWCAYFIMVKHSPIKIVYLCYPSLIYFILFGMTAGPFLELHKTSALMMHSCSHDPEHIRREVEVLRHDFNSRVKKILFNSVLGAYCSSFLPCCFAQVRFCESQ